MDLFLAACEGLGLAVAAGAVTGAIAGAAAARSEAGAPSGVLFVLAAVGVIAGAYLFGMSLSNEDHPSWPGWVVGALVALLAFSVASGVVRGAATRAVGASPGTQVIYFVIAAAVLAALSIFLPPVGLVAFLAVAYLAFARRQRAAQKHEGLRVLR